MVALFVMPSSLLVEILNYFPFGTNVCTLWIILDVLCCTSSIYHMSTMALDRYLTIKFPLKYGRNKSKRITLMKIITVWFLSILICSPIFILSISDSANVFDSEKNVCHLFNKKFRIYGSILAFYVPFLVMLIAYVSTIRILKNILDKKLDDKKQKMEENLRYFQKKTFTNVLEGLVIQTRLQLDLDANSHLSPKNECSTENATLSRSLTSNTRSRYSFVNYQSIKNVAQNEKKALKVLIIIFIVFVTLWSPFFIMNITDALCEDCLKQIFEENEKFFTSLISWLGYMSSMANPIVYTMFNKSFRTAFINILKCKKVSIERPRRMSFRQGDENLFLNKKISKFGHNEQNYFQDVNTNFKSLKNLNNPRNKMVYF